MPKVLIVVDAAAEQENSPAAFKMVAAMKQAIADRPIEAIASVEVVAADQLQPHPEAIYCPLTLNLPPSFNFPGQSIYQACKDIDGLRQQVERQQQAATGEGNMWLPIVLTAKGAIYGEAIAAAKDLPAGELAWQILHLSDFWRQPLYHLGFELLRSLCAPPAVYLLQFGIQAEKIIFDRLWPFPDAPALATLEVQQPDLFACHWRCLTKQPILDLIVSPPLKYQIFDNSY